MKHKIITNTDGSFSIERISSSCAYGKFATYGEAMSAITESACADTMTAE